MISWNCSFLHLIEFSRVFSIKDNRFEVLFRIRHPHDLHLILVLRKTQVDLFVSCFDFDVHFWEVDELFEFDLTVFVEVEGVEGGVEDVEGEMMVGFDEFEVIAELGPSDMLVVILIVSQCEELFEILFCR